MVATRLVMPIFDCFARHGSLRADRAVWPPTSSSLRDEKHVPSLLLSTTARDPIFDWFRSPRLAPRGSRCVAAYFVVAPGRKACPLTPPQHDGARSDI